MSKNEVEKKHNEKGVEDLPYSIVFIRFSVVENSTKESLRIGRGINKCQKAKIEQRQGYQVISHVIWKMNKDENILFINGSDVNTANAIRYYRICGNNVKDIVNSKIINSINSINSTLPYYVISHLDEE